MADPSELPEILSIQRARDLICERTGEVIPRRTMQRWARNRLLPGVQIGRRRFVRRDDLLRLLAGEPEVAAQ